MSMNLTALKQKTASPGSVAELEALLAKKIQNLETAWSEFDRGELTVNSMPSKAIIELTQNCNFKCTMCPQSFEAKFRKYNPKLNMSLETFVKIADQLFPLATFIDLRGFGETTMLPYWPEVVDYLTQFPLISWHLVTNLSLKRDAVWDKMMSAGFTLGFSCDGATAETFEKIRVRSRFSQIIDNLELNLDSRRRHKAGGIYFISTIQPANLHELRGIVELGKKYAVSEVQFKNVMGPLAPHLKTVDPLIVKKHVDEALDAALELGIKVNFNDWIFTQNVDSKKVQAANQIPAHGPIHPDAQYLLDMRSQSPYLKYSELLDKIGNASRVSENQRCFKPYSFTYVNYQAQMGTCNHMMDPMMLVMGDLNDESVKDIWNSKHYRQFRKQLTTARPMDRRCEWCFKHRLED